MVKFQDHALKASFHVVNLFLNVSIVSLIKTKYKETHITPPFSIIQSQHLTQLQKEKVTTQILGASMSFPQPMIAQNLVCILLLLPHTHSSLIQLYLVFISSSLAIPALLLAYCRKLSPGLQNTYTLFFFHTILSLLQYLDKCNTKCFFLKHKPKLHFINSQYSTKPFPTPYPPPSFYVQEASHHCNNCDSLCHYVHRKFGPLYAQPSQLAFSIYLGF